jgi:hypothetical protein
MIKMNELLYARMIKMLLDGASHYTIVAETGIHTATARTYLRALHKQRAVHVIGWIKNSRGADTTKIFKIGDGKDLPRTTMSRAEIAKRYKFKQKLRKRMQKEQSIIERRT